MPKFKLSKTTVSLIFTGVLFFSLVIIATNISTTRDIRPYAATGTQTKNPSTVESLDVGPGNAPWVSPNNAKSPDGVFTTSTGNGPDFLEASNFGFSLPSGATANKLTVRIKRFASLSNEATDGVYLQDANGAVATLCSGFDCSPRIETTNTYREWEYTGTIDFTTINTTKILYASEFKAGQSMSVSVDHIEISIDYFYTPIPTVSFSPDATPIDYNSSTTLRWSSTNATSCSASGAWFGSKDTSGSQSTGNLTNSKTYSLRCSGAGGSSPTKSVTVNVGAKPSNPDPDPKPPPDNGGGGTPTNPPPGGGLPSLPPAPPGIPGVAVPIDPNIVNILKINLSVPYLLGNIKSPLIVGGYVQDLELKPGISDYEVDVRGAKFALGKTLNIQIGGNKTLIKKLKLKTKAPKQPVKLGTLYLGDTNTNNKINDEDFQRYLDSIPTQDESSDVNADGVVNSLDWAILLVNFGKTGSR